MNKPPSSFGVALKPRLAACYILALGTKYIAQRLCLDVFFRPTRDDNSVEEHAAKVLGSVDQLEMKGQNQDSPHENVNCLNTIAFNSSQTLSKPLMSLMKLFPELFLSPSKV